MIQKTAFEILQSKLTIEDTFDFREKHIPEILEAMEEYKAQPIELPTDEEIYEKYSAFISTEVTLGFLTKEQGERLKWYYQTYLVNEIQGGNK